MPNLCPACTAPLVAFEAEGVEIDHCPACKGTWLDAGELDQIALLAGVPAQGLLAAGLHGPAAGSAAARRCPRCGSTLRLVPVGAALRLDGCPRGDGLWFDRGELLALLARSGDTAADEAVKSFLAALFRHELAPERRTTA